MSGCGLSALFVITAMVLAGCSGKKLVAPTALEEDAAPPEFDGETGAISGVVLNDEFVPVPGVDFGLLAVSKTTHSDSRGHFTFSRLPPTTYDMAITKIGYETKVQKIIVKVGQETDVQVVVVPIVVELPYPETKIQKGLLGCGVTETWSRATVNLTSINGKPGVNGGLGLAACGLGGNTTAAFDNDKFLLTWAPVKNSSRWETGIFEMQWQSNQALGSALEMYWEVNGCANTNATFAFAAGKSPLIKRVDRDGLYDVMNKSSTKKASCGGSETQCNFVNCTAMSRVFPGADTLGADAPLDVGLILQQPFEQYFTAYMNGPAPPGFSALKS